MKKQTDDSKLLFNKLKTLVAEAGRLGKTEESPSRQLRILLLKKDLQDLLKQLRREKDQLDAQRSQQTKLTAAATAYSRIGALTKPGRRR